MNVSNLLQLEIIRISYPNSLIFSKCEYLTLINLFETWITNGLLCHYFGPKCQLLNVSYFVCSVPIYISWPCIVKLYHKLFTKHLLKEIYHWWGMQRYTPSEEIFIIRIGLLFNNSFYASMDTYINLCELSINCAVIFSSRLLHFD